MGNDPVEQAPDLVQSLIDRFAAAVRTEERDYDALCRGVQNDQRSEMVDEARDALENLLYAAVVREPGDKFRLSLCGVLTQHGPDPLACGYPRGHTGPHSWSRIATITVNPATV
jgi:hypothetical protein